MLRVGTRFLTVAGVLLATLVTVPTAARADTSMRFAPTVTVFRPSSTQGLTTATTAASPITCKTNAQYPHNSTDVPGTVNAVITTNCFYGLGTTGPAAPVAELSGVMDLYWGSLWIAGGLGSTYGSPTMSMNAATPCVSGNYHSDGGVAIFAPPGYTPTSTQNDVTSATRAITCNTAPKVWVTTFANAPGYSKPGGTRTGTLNAGTNYVYCKVWGPIVQSGSSYNHWWLLTDLDSGNPWRNQYVSAYYLSKWGNDVAKDNNGVVIRNC
jgi:hypothetical protein